MVSGVYTCNSYFLNHVSHSFEKELDSGFPFIRTRVWEMMSQIQHSDFRFPVKLCLDTFQRSVKRSDALHYCDSVHSSKLY